MGKTVLEGGLVFTEECRFERIVVSFGGGDILSVGGDADGGEVIDCSGCYVLPGLTDVHMHGCAGHDLSDDEDGALAAMAAFEYAHGVTSFCPAVMTLPDKKITDILRRTAAYVSGDTGAHTAAIAGIHLEGPFVSEKKCGAQNREYIAKPSAAKLRKWQQAAGGLIKLVTIAPETEGAIDCIRECAGEFRFSLGHTACGYDTAAAAFAAGADRVTHLFNAMPAFHHRDTGLIGAAFDRENCFAELICDGIHVSAPAVRAAFRLFGDDRIVLISDSMEAAGMPDGEYSLGGQIVIKRGKRAELGDGTIAGSVSTLYDCLLKAVGFGIPLESAVRAATRNPCLSAGLFGRYGSIAPGKAARFLILRQSDLSIKAVI